FYMDVHIHRAITEGLRLRGVDVLTAQEDGRGKDLDPNLLNRATTLHRLLFTNDDDFLTEAAQRQQTGEPFSGVVYVHQLKLGVGPCIEQLEVIAKLGEPAEF